MSKIPPRHPKRVMRSLESVAHPSEENLHGRCDAVGDAATETLGPIDYLVVEFEGMEFDGSVLETVTDLIARGTVRILDIALVAKDADGMLAGMELEDLDGFAGGPLEGLSNFIADLVTEEELMIAGQGLSPGSCAVILVWENTWAVPFVTAMRAKGGEVTASGRLASADVLEALAATN
jgi:hypothetical protein